MTLQQLLEHEGYRTCSYSGRAMYGETCLAVRVDDVTHAMYEIGRLTGMTGVKAPGRMRFDQMGLRWVIYWPELKYEDNGEEDEA